jgi:hypothetical protein
MDDRNVVVRDDSSSVVSAGLVFVAVLIIAALAAMFVWQPWRAFTPERSSTTTIQVNPGAPGGAGTSGTTNGTTGGMSGGTNGGTTNGSTGGAPK